MLRLTAFAATPLTAEQMQAAPRLRLTYQERVRSRLAAVLPSGEAVAITLPRGSVLRHGAVLVGDGGEHLIVEAVAEPVTRVTSANALALLRAVYHLANRHVPAQLGADHAVIERDPVLERMLAGLGAKVEHIEAPFDPEAGAYNVHGHAHAASHREEIDEASATVGEQLSIAAHRARGGT
ncbi:MAG: urease accessory protein UreE [Burkholderiaceae bacterium]